jgi:outer membrane lipoprotein-sorting protein
MNSYFSFSISLVVFSLIIFAAYPCFGTSDREVDDLLLRSNAAFEQIRDYRCTFHKRELIRGKLESERNITFKFRKPASFYLGFKEGENKGGEAIYVEGKFDNKLKFHKGGIMGLFSMTLDTDGSLAMRHNRHPITESGIGHIIRLMEKDHRMAKNDPECSVQVEKSTLSNGRQVFLIKAVQPPGKGYYGHKVIVAIDQGLLLPVKVTVFGWKDELLEEYEYEGLKLNVGLTDRDFDPENPEYDF